MFSSGIVLGCRINPQLFLTGTRKFIAKLVFNIYNIPFYSCLFPHFMYERIHSFHSPTVSSFSPLYSRLPRSETKNFSETTKLLVPWSASSLFNSSPEPFSQPSKSTWQRKVCQVTTTRFHRCDLYL